MSTQMTKLSLVVASFGLLVFSVAAGAQTLTKEGKVIADSNCEDIIGAIDRSLAEATESDSNVIAIVKVGRAKSTSLNLARAKGLRNYFVHRGFKNFEIGVDVLASSTASLNIFVNGKRLYSLSIAASDRLDLTPCVVGTSS